MPNKLQIKINGLSDKGCHRDNNEDAIYWGNYGSDLNNVQPLLALVADGMGGHNAGEVASSMAIENIKKFCSNGNAEQHSELARYFNNASQMIYQAAKNNIVYKGMGTTCVALLIDHNLAFCASVGDSRLYLIRGDSIYQMTEDHTVYHELKREGVVATGLEQVQLQSSLLTRSLGTKPSVTVDTWPQAFPLKANDCFILCTDGLSDLLGDQEIKQFVQEKNDHDVCGQLVAEAKRRGGYDNISVVVVCLY